MALGCLGLGAGTALLCQLEKDDTPAGCEAGSGRWPGRGPNDSRWHRLASTTSPLYLPRQAVQALWRNWGVCAAAPAPGQCSVSPGVTLSGLQVGSVLKGRPLSGLWLTEYSGCCLFFSFHVWTRYCFKQENWKTDGLWFPDFTSPASW